MELTWEGGGPDGYDKCFASYSFLFKNRTWPSRVGESQFEDPKAKGHLDMI